MKERHENKSMAEGRQKRAKKKKKGKEKKETETDGIESVYLSLFENHFHCFLP